MSNPVATHSATSTKPWEHAKHGEGSSSDPLAARFVESLSFDTRLYDADIRGSIAHARMLQRVGLISERDLAEIERGLGEIRREIESAQAGPNAVGVPGAWPGWQIALEDVHMCVEAALVAKVGDAGRKLHTGRSRNDQVALDLRVWLRDACDRASEALDELLLALVAVAHEQGDIVMPSYTHLQRAQPIVLGAECMAWHAMFARDKRAFQRTLSVEDGLSASPLGAGAVAGSSLGLDRASVANDLGFSSVSVSSIDATASRDEALDFLYALTRTALHLSRLAEQWIIYATSEFSFLTLGEAYTTGSSMMPQKRNPDMLELIRGKCGTISGHFQAMLMIVKGLPLAYNRDLQEDKRHIFAAYDTLIDCVRIAARVVASARFDEARIASTLDRGHLDATILAEYFVTKGVAFRTAHQIVGSLVRLCESRSKHALSELGLADFKSVLKDHACDPALVGADVFASLGPAKVVAHYRSAGHAGSGPGGYRDWLAGQPQKSTPRSDATHAQTQAQATASKASLFPELDGASEPHTDALAPLIEAYRSIGRTLDDLPYTSDFDRLYSLASAAMPGSSPQQVFRKLHNLRKAGKLPAGAQSKTQPVKLQPEEELWLRERVVGTVGSLGQRDQLPFDPRFDALIESFNAHTGRQLDAHNVWRLVAKLAK